MKRLITTICAVFVFCFVLSGTAVQAAAEYQGTLSKRLPYELVERNE